MDFNPDTWGTVADWVGGLGTTAAFIAAVVVIAKDAKVRKIAQAHGVAYVTESQMIHQDVGERTVVRQAPRYVLKNLSDEPIYDVIFCRRTRSAADRGRAIVFQDFVLPGDKFTYHRELREPPLACFRDNSGVLWAREINGRIHTIFDLHIR